MSDTLERSPLVVRFRQYFVAGVFVVIPLGLTFFILQWLFGAVSSIGRPVVRWLSQSLVELARRIAAPTQLDESESVTAKLIESLGLMIGKETFLEVLGVLLVITVICLLGWLATNVIGRQLLDLVDRAIGSIPLVKAIYSTLKQLLAAFQQKPEGVQRVVLIDFPHESAKCVGFVTRTFRDADTGRELAAVYVPTTPNPTSGYLEIVPVERLINTTWSMDEAMKFIVSGGAVSPESINYERSASNGTKSAEGSAAK